MNDWDIMQRCRVKWARALVAAGRPPLDEKMAAAYHRGFMDALEIALDRVIAEERTAPQNSRP